MQFSFNKCWCFFIVLLPIFAMKENTDLRGDEY